jgi:hypothetical protein
MANAASAFWPDYPVLRIMIAAFAAPRTLQMASTVALTVPAADRQWVARRRHSPLANTRSTPVTVTRRSAVSRFGAPTKDFCGQS